MEKPGSVFSILQSEKTAPISGLSYSKTEVCISGLKREYLFLAFDAKSYFPFYPTQIAA